MLQQFSLRLPLRLVPLNRNHELHPMSLGPREKQQLYHSLAQLLRAGITFPQAVEKLSRTAAPPLRRLLSRLRASLQSGRTVAEACAEARPAIGAMEASVLVAVERAGRLDRGLDQLSKYFAEIARAKGRILAKLAYPVFLLVFGVLVLNVPVAFTRGGGAFAQAVLGPLAAAVLLTGALGLAITLLFDAAVFSSLADASLRAIPGLGGMHRAFSMARFCLAYDLQLEAGVNTLDALHSAARASRSALVRQAVDTILPEVRAGSPPGPLLAATGAFAPIVAETISVGEETGTLGTELHRLSLEQQTIAFNRLEGIADWLPRFAYLAILIFLATRILATFQGVMGEYQKILDGM
jgi:type II secretory pathway component PulF